MDQYSSNVVGEAGTDALTTNMNILYVLLAGALVFFMETGFAMLCAGSIRAKNVKNVILWNLLDACGGGIAFWVSTAMNLEDHLCLNIRLPDRLISILHRLSAMLLHSARDNQRRARPSLEPRDSFSRHWDMEVPVAILVPRVSLFMIGSFSLPLLVLFLQSSLGRLRNVHK